MIFMEDLHVMKSGLEEEDKSLVRAHHSGYLQGKKWNRGQEGKVLGGLGKIRWRVVVAGQVRVGDGPHCLPKDDTDLRCCIEHALCRGDHR